MLHAMLRVLPACVPEDILWLAEATDDSHNRLSASLDIAIHNTTSTDPCPDPALPPAQAAPGRAR